MPMLGRGRKQTSRIFQNLYSLLLYSSIVYYTSPTPCHSHDIPPAKEVMAKSQLFILNLTIWGDIQSLASAHHESGLHKPKKKLWH